jgi:hypothetical protein
MFLQTLTFLMASKQKIIYFKVKLPVDKDAWIAENAQRNAISLAPKDAKDDDIALLQTDVGILKGYHHTQIISSDT